LRRNTPLQNAIEKKGNCSMSRRLLIMFALLALVVGVLSPAVAGAQDGVVQAAPSSKQVAESPTGSYIVVMAADPLVVTEGQANLGTSAARGKADKLKKSHKKALEDAGASSSDAVNSYTNALNGFSAFLSYSEAQALAADPMVALVMPDELQQLDTNSSPEYLGLTQKGGAYDNGLTGEGVIVGVIDSGIWPEHPSFADDGTYPDLGIVLDSSRPTCEFGNTAHNPDDAAFTCNQKLLGARQMLDTYRAFIGAESFEFDSARDDNGHGTHTASTAAGNAAVAAEMYGVGLGEVSGIAPRARVIAYKGLGALGGFTSDLASAIDQAVFDGVHVINYSVGGGASLPTGGDDIAFLFAATAGVFVATSAGNSGPGAATVGSPGNAPWLTTVGANTQRRFYQGSAALMGGPTVKGASLTVGTSRATLVDAEFAGGDLCVPGTLDPAEVAGNIVLCRRGAIARAAKSQAVAMAGGVGMIMYNNSDSDNLFTDTHVVPSVHVDLTEGLKVKSYITHRTNKGRTPLAQIMDTGSEKIWAEAPSMTIFSSRGPNGPLPDLIKPDITAPGLQILAGDSPYANAAGNSFQAIAGTSMSSPHMAGVFALLKQAHPDWSAAAAKSAVMTTADPRVLDNDRHSKATPFSMGSGEVDPGKVSQPGSAFNPGLIYDAGLFEYAAFTCGANLGVFTPGSCDFLEAIGVPSDTSDLNVASIGIAELAGSQTVVRTVTSVADATVEYEAEVKAPAGYSVSVSPATMTIAPGDSVTLEITITNNSAPAGDWRFGEMTLKGDDYSVRSPIAVKGTPLGAPTVIEGTGTSGTASFDVSFGYTGDYTAAPHGLVAETAITGDISMDPDQTYPSGDDGIGVDKIAFNLSGSAFVRWEMVIPGPDDVDLFLEDSSGTIIAASTNGGTDELIELMVPADGTYTMVVHGWSVPNQPLPYTLSFWDVPLASGGSLTVNSAPASAALGATGTVEIGWSGLAASTRYLGAVSHSDGAGLLGLTLVEIAG
jgi:subtilisin family serine protease